MEEKELVFRGNRLGEYIYMILPYLFITPIFVLLSDVVLYQILLFLFISTLFFFSLYISRKKIYVVDFYDNYFVQNFFLIKKNETVPYTEILKIENVSIPRMSTIVIHIKNKKKKVVVRKFNELEVFLRKKAADIGFSVHKENW